MLKCSGWAVGNLLKIDDMWKKKNILYPVPTGLLRNARPKDEPEGFHLLSSMQCFAVVPFVRL
jgi:hypothetical protein